ncbi:hypothetical protein [Helicobacter sp. WB40]|uniref:hypothetical protein n=1 Tax=Helicobacter sp. WB40 TaxID=3004130 RepID=UPI0022EBB31C|nr:hypothetical protein [Helicobacter sp. WB40]MDA3967270.1 hypothetical protein [Helicobacter sp. WB40]
MITKNLSWNVDKESLLQGKLEFQRLKKIKYSFADGLLDTKILIYQADIFNEDFANTHHINN